MPLTIRIASPSEVGGRIETQQLWGDHWVKAELADAFRAMGHTIVEGDPGDPAIDVLLHLSGGGIAYIFKRPIEQVAPRAYKIAWVYSHPEKVTPTSLKGYHHLFCCSVPFADKMRAMGYRVTTLLGATNKRPLNKPITYDVGFSAKGALTRGAAAASDATTTLAETSKGCSAGLGGTPLADVRKWTLSITATNPTYNSSSTAGATGRVAGNIDATVAIDVYCDDFADLPAPGTETSVELWVGSTAVTTGSWQLTYARVGDLSNLAVDVETGAPVSATINLALTAIAEADTLGAIKAPGGSTVWPAA